MLSALASLTAITKHALTFGCRPRISRHFCRFNSNTPNLDLIVDATEKLQHAIWAIAAAITCEIDEILRVVAERILQEPFLLFLGRVDVPECAERASESRSRLALPLRTTDSSFKTSACAGATACRDVECHAVGCQEPHGSISPSVVSAGPYRFTIFAVCGMTFRQRATSTSVSGSPPKNAHRNLGGTAPLAIAPSHVCASVGTA